MRGGLAPNPDPVEVAATFANVRLSAQRALDELEVLLDVLHGGGDPDVPLGRRLAEALDGARAAGLRVHAAVPPCDHVPATVADTAYRVVQEGLTNAVKHAPGSDVDVEVAIADGRLRLSVRDAGRRGWTRCRRPARGSACAAWANASPRWEESSRPDRSRMAGRLRAQLPLRVPTAVGA